MSEESSRSTNQTLDEKLEALAAEWGVDPEEVKRHFPPTRRSRTAFELGILDPASAAYLLVSSPAFTLRFPPDKMVRVIYLETCRCRGRVERRVVATTEARLQSGKCSPTHGYATDPRHFLGDVADLGSGDKG